MLTSASRSMEILCSSLTDLRRTWLALAATLPLGGGVHSVQGGSPTSGLSRSSSVNSLDSFRLEADLTKGSSQERYVCWTCVERVLDVLCFPQTCDVGHVAVCWSTVVFC